MTGSSDDVHLLCCANTAYAAPLAVMLKSVELSLSPRRQAWIYIFYRGMEEKAKRRVAQTLDPRQMKIRWFPVEEQILHRFEGNGHAGKETYLRLWAPDFLPTNLHRVIYLDVDLVVLRDIGELWDSSTDAIALHAVREVGNPFVSSQRGVFNYRDLGLPSDAPYFNAGVLVMNLALWRSQNIKESVVSYLLQHGPRVHSWDQGALNACLCGQWRALDFRWNQTASVSDPDAWRKLGYSQKEYRAIRDNPFIVHFTGEAKPWHDNYRENRKYVYGEFLKKTAFGNRLPALPFGKENSGAISTHGAGRPDSFEPPRSWRFFPGFYRNFSSP